MAPRRTTNPCLPIAARLWPKIAKAGPDDCWLWQAYKNAHGYGVLGKNNGTLLAHRVVYEDAVGPIPAGLHVLHRCDNPPCCNPAHLWLGTHADNMADMREKGRWSLHHSCEGERNRAAKLTPEQVLEIRAAPGRHDRIAWRYGITASNVSVIKLRKSWAYLPD